MITQNGHNVSYMSLPGTLQFIPNKPPTTINGKNVSEMAV